jgi:hypothetical protein
VADLEALEQREPTPPDILVAMARVLGLPRTAVAKALRPRSLRPKVRRAS